MRVVLGWFGFVFLVWFSVVVALGFVGGLLVVWFCLMLGTVGVVVWVLDFLWVLCYSS